MTRLDLEPTFDVDGYPTEETLQTIRDWPITSMKEQEAVLAFVGRAWNWPSYFVRVGRRVRPWRGASLHRRWLVSTGGWSGNESLIAAMEANVMFWALAWHSSTRGGHYEFRTQT